MLKCDRIIALIWRCSHTATKPAKNCPLPAAINWNILSFFSGIKIVHLVSKKLSKLIFVTVHIFVGLHNDNGTNFIPKTKKSISTRIYQQQQMVKISVWIFKGLHMMMHSSVFWRKKNVLSTHSVTFHARHHFFFGGGDFIITGNYAIKPLTGNCLAFFIDLW